MLWVHNVVWVVELNPGAVGFIGGLVSVDVDRLVSEVVTGGVVIVFDTALWQRLLS